MGNKASGNASAQALAAAEVLAAAGFDVDWNTGEVRRPEATTDDEQPGGK